MFYILTHRVNYATQEDHLVWMKTKSETEIFAMMDALSLNDCIIREFRD